MQTISNYCRFIGRLTSDPKMIEFDSGARLTTFRLAITEYRKVKDGDTQAFVNFFDFEAWDTGGEVIFSKCKKGDKIEVVACARNNNWSSKKTGKMHQTTRFRVNEFEILSNKKKVHEVA